MPHLQYLGNQIKITNPPLAVSLPQKDYPIYQLNFNLLVDYFE